MEPTSRNRWMLLAGALALTLAAAGYVGGDDGAPEPPAAAKRPNPNAAAGEPARGAPREREPAAVPEVAIDKLTARKNAAPVADPFRSLSWQSMAQEEARKSAPPPPPPPTPQAPPLPFKYMGKLVEDGKLTVFLIQGDKNVIAREGDTLDGTYRIDAVTEHSMTMTYLPLKQKQQLALGDAP
jgi:hypothetical protein